QIDAAGTGDGAALDLFTLPKPTDLRLNFTTDLHASRIINVEHSKVVRLLVLKDARLHGRIDLEGAVTIKMVRRDIQDCSDVRAKLDDGLKLEARDLEHIPSLIIRGGDHLG